MIPWCHLKELLFLKHNCVFLCFYSVCLSYPLLAFVYIQFYHYQLLFSIVYCFYCLFNFLLCICFHITNQSLFNLWKILVKCVIYPLTDFSLNDVACFLSDDALLKPSNFIVLTRKNVEKLSKFSIIYSVTQNDVSGIKFWLLN